MRISVVIATYNRWGWLGPTLESVLAQDHPSFEVIVVDQTNPAQMLPDRLIRLLQDSRTRYYRVGPPSLPAARNFGLNRASGDIIVYIDDDVELSPGFLGGHEEVYNDLAVAGVAGRVLDVWNPVSEVPPRFLSSGSFEGWFSYLSHSKTNAVYGCNMSFRRDVLLNVGGFDTGFVGNAVREESDLGLRIIKKGMQIVFNPNAQLFHVGAPEGGCRDAKVFDSIAYYRNNTLFFIKNFHVSVMFSMWWKLFADNVYPLKSNPQRFNSRLGYFFRGSKQALWHRLFGRQFQQQVVVKNPMLSEGDLVQVSR